MEKLYPLKFQPIYKSRIWGGNKFTTHLNRKDAPTKNCGESWEISAVEDNISIISNGALKGNTIQEAIEIYMDELIGYSVYEKFGVEFPILLKFLDSKDILSVQVHPDNLISKDRHNAYGKSEMWYVLDAENDSELILGFNQKMTRDSFLEASLNGELSKYLQKFSAKAGDVYNTPSGTVHAIGKGILLAEIQQTSDVTYRIDDWGRVDTDGKPRELHLDLALDAINYNGYNLSKENCKTPCNKDCSKNHVVTETKTCTMVNSEHFKTNLISLTESLEKDYYNIDSFILYMCVEGDATIDYGEEEKTTITKGETVLIPASLNEITLSPNCPTKIIEIHI